LRSTICCVEIPERPYFFLASSLPILTGSPLEDTPSLRCPTHQETLDPFFLSIFFFVFVSFLAHEGLFPPFHFMVMRFPPLVVPRGSLKVFSNVILFFFSFFFFFFFFPCPVFPLFFSRSRRSPGPFNLVQSPPLCTPLIHFFLRRTPDLYSSDLRELHCARGQPPEAFHYRPSAFYFDKPLADFFLPSPPAEMWYFLRASTLGSCSLLISPASGLAVEPVREAEDPIQVSIPLARRF